MGKTTTAVNLSSALAREGKKVLLIDFDSQANASSGLGLQRSLHEPSVYSALVGQQDLRSVILHHKNPDIDIAPASALLANLDAQEVNENRLKELIEDVERDYDYIFIDCPPALGLLNTNALTAAQSVLIPVQCEYYALEGLTQLLLTIRMIQMSSNPDLSIEGILLTMFDPRTRLSSEVSQEVRHTFDALVYEQPIPRNIKLSEAPSRSVSIFEYDASSPGAKAYREAARAMLGKENC